MEDTVGDENERQTETVDASNSTGVAGGGHKQEVDESEHHGESGEEETGGETGGEEKEREGAEHPHDEVTTAPAVEEVQPTPIPVSRKAEKKVREEYDYDDDDEEEEEEEEDEEEEEAGVKLTPRQQMELDLLAALEVQDDLLNRNDYAQHRLVKHFEARQHSTGQEDVDPKDLEEQFMNLTEKMMLMRNAQDLLREQRDKIMEELRQQALQKIQQGATNFQALQAAQRRKMLSGINHSSRAVVAQRVAKLLELQTELWRDAKQLTLTQNRMKHSIARLESDIRKKEKTSFGMNTMDYEQLKLDNQRHTESIEKINLHMSELSAGLLDSSQNLTHYKEKIAFVWAINEQMKKIVRKAEIAVSSKREKLITMKREREGLKKDAESLHQRCALLNYPRLLVDYQTVLEMTTKQREAITKLSARLAHLHRESKLFHDDVMMMESQNKGALKKH